MKGKQEESNSMTSSQVIEGEIDIGQHTSERIYN